MPSPEQPRGKIRGWQRLQGQEKLQYLCLSSILWYCSAVMFQRRRNGKSSAVASEGFPLAPDLGFSVEMDELLHRALKSSDVA